MKPFRLDDLPPAMRAQAIAKLNSRQVKANEGSASMETAATTKNRYNGPLERVDGKSPKQTKTERDGCAYLAAIGYTDIRPFPATLRMANGHKYSPDAECCHPMGGKRIMVEIKGAYKLQSHGRARLAFDQCRRDWPEFDFLWIRKTKEGWRVE